MDSTAGYDPTLPLDLDGSCNPGLLPEVTFSNHLEFPNGNVPLIGKQNSGRMSPVRGTTMKEYDQIISELRKDNFSLKLRIFYLDERMQQKYGDGDDIFKTNIDLRVEVDSLKKELTDKQELLKKASLAMENLTANHQLELQQVKGQVELELRAQHRDLAEKYNQSLVESDNYHQNLEDSEKRVLGLENQLESIQKELEETKSNQIKDCQQLNEALQTIQYKQSDISQLEDLLKKNEEERQKEKEKYDGMEKRLEEELQQMKKHIGRKERDIQDAMEDQKETVKNLQNKLRENQKKVADKTDMVAELEDQLYQLERDNKELTNKINQSEAASKIQEENTYKRDKTIQGFITALSKKEKEVTVLSDKLKEKEKEVEKLSEELHKTNIDHNKKLLKSLGQKDGKLVEFKEMLVKAEKAMKNSEAALEGLQDQLNKEKHDGHSRADNLAQHYQTLLDDLQNQVKNKEKLLHQLTDRLKDKDRQLHDCFNLLDTEHLQANGNNPADLLKKLQQKLKDKDMALENQEREKSRDLDNKENEIRSLKQSLRQKEQDLSQANHMLLSVEDKSERLEREVKDKEEKLTQLANCLQGAQKSFDEAMDNHVRAIEQKSNMINRLKESIDARESALQESMEKSPGLSTDQVKKLKQQLRAKETTIQELLNEKNELMGQHEKTSRDFFNRLKLKDREYKTLQEKENKERNNLEKDLLQLQTDINKRDLEIQRLESGSQWAEDQLDKLRESLKEKDKTIEALFESGKEKDKLLQQAQQTRSPSVSSSITDMAHLQSLQDEIAFLLNHVASKDAVINQLRSESESLPWQQKEIDRLSDELIKKGDALKSSKNTEGKLESQLSDLKRRVSELESQQTGQQHSNPQLYDLIRDQLSELKSLGDILRTERQLYINLNQTDTQHNTSSGTREVDRELEKIVRLREKLEDGVERNNTLRIVLEQQQATKPYNTEDKLNEEVKTSKEYYDKYLTNSPKKQTADKNTSPLKLQRVPVQTQTEITATLDQDPQELGDSSLVKFTDGEGDSLNLLNKSHLDSVNNSDFLNSQHRFRHLAERPSELTNLHNQCFARVSSGYGNTRDLGCEHYASSEASTSETTGLNPHETVITSNRKFQTVHSPPQLLRKEEPRSKGQGHKESSPAVLPPNVLIDNQKVHIVSPHKVSFLDDSVFAGDNPHSSIHSSPHMLRHHTHSSHLSSHPQSITHIDSTRDQTESVTSDLHRDFRLNSLSDLNELSLPEVDIDRLSVDQSVLLSEDISNMSAQSLRKLVSKLQDSLIDSLQENQNLKDQVRESIGSRQIPGKNESDPTAADLQVIQQKMDQLQSKLSKSYHENESLKKHSSPRLSISEEDVQKLKEKLAKMENNNQLLKKQIILNTKSSSAPSGFNPELIVDMANEIERLNKVVAETKLNASDSDENSANGSLAQDGTASPKGNTSRARSSSTLEESSPGDVPEQNIPNDAPKIPNTASHIPRLRKPTDSKSSKPAPLVVVHNESESDPSVLKSLLEAARSSIQQLEEKLAATEDTVRFQSSKMKYYRGLATDAGLIPKMSSRSQSETNLSKLSKNPSVKTSSCENLTDFNENGSITTEESKDYGKTENVTALKMQIDELINKLQRQTLEINNLKTKSFNRTCRSLSPPNESPRIKELKDQLRESAQQNSGKEFVSSSKLSPSVEPQTIPEQDYIQNLKIRFPENEKLRNSAEKNFRWRSPSPSSQRSLEFSGRNFKSRSQSDIDSLDGKNNQELVEQCRGLKDELEEVKHDNSILAARLVELGGSNNQRQLPVETLTNQMKSLEEEKKQLEVNLQKANSRIEDFETEIRSYRFEKMRLEKSLISGEQKMKWLQQDKNLSETDQELLLVRQQLHDSQNTCLQLRNQLEEISCFLTELISQDNQSETNSTVSGARFDKIKQHLQYSKDVIDASLSDVSRIDERSRLDEVDHVTESKYQRAVDEINKLQKELNLQEARSQEQLCEKATEINNLRDEIESISRHGVPEGCDSDVSSSHRSISSDNQLSPQSFHKSSKVLSSPTDRRSCFKPVEIQEDLSVDQIRQRFASGQTDITSVTGVTDLTSDRGSYTKNSTVLVNRSPLNDRGGYSNTSFRDRGDYPNDISRKGGNLSALYFSKMEDSDFLLSESHFCNQSNGSIFGGRHGEALLDSSDTRSKASDDTLSHVSSYKEGSITPTGSEIITLKSRLSVVEELNQTLKAEINVYENMVQTGKNTPQNRSFHGYSSHQGQGELHDHLAEIRALRLRLEKSLDDCEKLQIQLEERLGESQEDERMKYENKIQELNSLISDLKSKLSHSENIIKEKVIIIEEKEKTLYRTKIILEKNNQKLAESDGQFSEIQKTLSKSEKFQSDLKNNYSILKNQNTELLTKCSLMENRNSELERKCSLVENSKSDLKQRCSLAERKCSEMEKQRQQMEVNRQQMEHHYEKFQQRKEKQEAQLKKAGKEIKKLQQEILLWKEKAEERGELNKTLKLELSMHEKIQHQFGGGDKSNLDISDLLTEVRHLRIQLERCIDTNNRLRQTIEGLLHQQLKQSKHQHSTSSSTASDAADGRPSPQNSPYKSPEHQRKTIERETYIHRKTREDNYEYDIVDRSSHDRRREDRTENGYRSPVYDQSAGPRYKIESSNQKDPGQKPTPTGEKTSRFMTSIPNRCPNPNTSIHSLPSDLDRHFDKERSIKYWVDTATYREVPHVDVDSDIRRLFAIGKLDDFEKIRKENEEELAVLRGLEARVHDRINSLKRTTEQSIEYSTLKEIALAIENLRICMDAEGTVIKRFWISQLPPVNEIGEFYDAKLAEENHVLRKELAKAKSEADLVKHSARNTEHRLLHTTRQRQGMEDAICQQLTRTNKILQQASDNFKTTNKVGPYLTPNGALYLDDLKNK